MTHDDIIKMEHSKFFVAANIFLKPEKLIFFVIVIDIEPEIYSWCPLVIVIDIEPFFPLP